MTDTARYDVDPQLRVEFVDAALEGLTGLGNLFVQLEADPGHPETVEAIFRVVHSIKGNAAFFELMKVQALAHESETLLDRIRKGQVAPTRAVIDVLLAATDALAAIFVRAREGRAEVEDSAGFDAMLARLTRVGLGGGGHTVPAAVGADAVAARGAVSAQAVASLWRDQIDSLRAMGECRTLEAALGLAARALDTAHRLAAASGDGGAPPGLGAAGAWPEAAARLRALLASGGAQEVFDDARAARVGALLHEVRDSVEGAEALAIFDEAAGSYRLLLDTIGVDPLLREILNDAVKKIAALGAWKHAPAAAKAGARAREGGRLVRRSRAGRSHPAGETRVLLSRSADFDNLLPPVPAAKTMRVSEESIDGFLSRVGDLDGIGEMYEHLQTRLAAADTAVLAEEMRRVNEVLDATTARLRRSILEIRKMPLHALLQRVPRIVRDIAAPAGKEIEVRMAGEEMLVDKSIVDTLEAPLVHLVRNAADHGIETPDARQAAGKPRSGLVEITASETPDHVVLSVRDDGRGIDFAALRRQAASLGLVPAGGELSEAETVGLLFKSGVSTAPQVTEISGRGVGMDVVRRSIDAMGGKISVTTEPGRGSTFTIELPKTVGTQVLTGFIANVGGERFILPMDRIIQYFRPQSGDLRRVRGRGECVLHKGELLAVRDLGEVRGQPSERPHGLADGFLIVVETNGRRIALHADDVEGIRQVVLQRGDAPEDESGLFLGTALVGNGQTARVVDLDRLAGENV